MHSARPTGWTGEIPPPSEAALPGRHPRNTAPGGARDRFAAAGIPNLPDGAPWSVTPVAHDPLADTDPTGGLSKFDLGMVPASVTPPRTWRRAAWFAVISSAATLGGLMFATSALVGSSTSFQVVDLPNMPRGGVYPPLPSDPYVYTTEPGPQQGLHGDTASPKPTGALPPPGGRESRVAGTRPGPGQPAQAVRPSPTPAPGGVQGGQGDGSGPPGDGDGTPSGTVPSPTSPPPSSESETPSALAGLALFPDTEAMRKRTDTYFAAVSAGDLREAFEMTTGELREEGFAAFAARYAGAESIEVVDSSVDWSSTVTTLRITREDGTRLTQSRRLEFTTGKDPRIEADELVS